MPSEVLVRAEKVSKRFCKNLKRSLWYGLQDLKRELRGRRYNNLQRLPQRSADVPLRPDEFWALKDVSFTLRRGETLGLIGRNGAGKTTLLRILNGLIKPDTGNVEIRGVVGAIISLGAGFNPLLTGRENIKINAAVLGLAKHEVDRLIPRIVDFAEIGHFIDSPVQTYSSGMQVRLGFSVAVHINCDVLILDEILAVGDASFRAKCYDAVDKLKNKTATIFVSHSEQSISRLCTSAVLLQNGVPTHAGTPEEVLLAYNSSEVRQQRPVVVYSTGISGIKDVSVNGRNVHLEKSNLLSIDHDARFTIEFKISSDTEIQKAVLNLTFFSRDGDPVAEVSNFGDRTPLAIPYGESVARITVAHLLLNPDVYRTSLIVASPDYGIHYYWIKDLSLVLVQGKKSSAAQKYRPTIEVNPVPKHTYASHAY